MRCLLPLLALLALPALGRADDVAIVVGKDAIEFKAGSAVVAKYATAATVAKPYLYPVLAPNGVAVTRGGPSRRGCRARPPPTTSTRSPSGSATAT